MAPLNQFLCSSSIIRPVHVTLGPHPTLRSIIRTIEDPYYNKDSQYHHENVLSPTFDVRESDSAFFLEGEFPGVGRKEDISIEKLGPRTVLVESNAARFDIKAEWGQYLLAPLSSTQEGTLENQQLHVTSKEGVTMEPVQETTRGLNDVMAEENGTGANEREVKGEDDGPYVKLTERHVGYLQRSFTFPCPVDIDEIKARLRYGLLVMMVPKLKDAKKGLKKINIED